MKKVLFVFVIAAAFAACNSGETPATTADSAANKVDSVVTNATNTIDSAANKVDSAASAAKSTIDSAAKKVDSAVKAAH